MLPIFQASVDAPYLAGRLYFPTVQTYYKGKGKVHPITGHEGPEGEYMYSSTLSFISAPDGGEYSMPLSGRLTLGKGKRYPLYTRLDGPQGRSGPVRKISSPHVFDPRTAQLVASRYTD